MTLARQDLCARLERTEKLVEDGSHRSHDYKTVTLARAGAFNIRYNSAHPILIISMDKRITSHTGNVPEIHK